MSKEFTGYHDVDGKKIYLGDTLVHELDMDGDMKGKVYKESDGTYSFGGGFELQNYGAGARVEEESE